MRVSPRELAEALTSLEVKKGGLDGDPDTIALGDAIRQLDVNSTPEELLAEMRALQGLRQDNSLRSEQRKRVVLLRGITAMTLVLACFLWWFTLRRAVTPPSMITAAAPALVTEPKSYPEAESYPVFESVPAGQLVGGECQSVLDLAKGRSINGLRVDARLVNTGMPREGNLWLIQKTPSGIRTQVWAGQSEALKVANGRAALVYSNPNPGGELFEMVPVEIDVSRFLKASPNAVSGSGTDPSVYGVRLAESK